MNELKPRIATKFTKIVIAYACYQITGLLSNQSRTWASYPGINLHKAIKWLKIFFPHLRKKKSNFSYSFVLDRIDTKEKKMLFKNESSTDNVGNFYKK